MNFNEAYNLAVTYLRADIPTALWGHPGIGKSALAQKIADAFDLLFIDIRLGQIDPVDLNGFIHKDPTTGTFDYLPWARFPLERQELPPILDADGRLQYVDVATKQPDGSAKIERQVKRYKGWLIMFDEINVAPRQNLAAAYKIFLDRMVGSHKLHAKCRLMLGGNLVGEGLAGAIPAPLVSRVAHITMQPALVDAHKTILGSDIYNFLINYPKYIYQETKEPNTPFPSLRPWEMLRRYEKANPTVTVEGVMGLVGMAAATAYLSFKQQSQALTALLSGNAPFPLEKSQDLIDYLSTDPALLQAHLHRFQQEWVTLAQVKLQSLLDKLPRSNP